MTTTPPEQQPPESGATTGTTRAGGTGGLPWLGGTPDAARLPIPGNAEFLLYLAALIVAWLVAWLTDSLTANHWFTFFTATTVAYLLSRGIAKASRVLEH